MMSGRPLIRNWWKDSEDAIAHPQSYALMENFHMNDGRVLTDQLSTYLIQTVLEVPDKVEPVIVELPEPPGSLGNARHG